MSDKDILKEARDFLNRPNYTLISYEARQLLKALADEVERLRKQTVTMAQDARHDAQAAADEAYWRDKQGGRIRGAINRHANF